MAFALTKTMLFKVLYSILLSDILLNSILLYDILLYDILLNSILLYDILLCDILLNSILLCDILQSCADLFSAACSGPLQGGLPQERDAGAGGAAEPGAAGGGLVASEGLPVGAARGAHRAVQEPGGTPQVLPAVPAPLPAAPETTLRSVRHQPGTHTHTHTGTHTGIHTHTHTGM